MEARPESSTGRASRGRRLGWALGILVGLGVAVLQVDWWERGPTQDLLARAPVRTGPRFEEWIEPVRTGFVEVHAVAGGGGDLRQEWVRVWGLHPRTVLSGPLPAEGTAVVPVGEDPVIVQVRHGESRAEVRALTLTPLEERTRAWGLRWTVWAGWLGLGALVARHVVRSARHRVRGGLTALALIGVWFVLATPSLEWLEFQIDPPRRAAYVLEPEPAPPARGEPPARAAPARVRKRDRLPFDPFVAFHVVGFFVVGAGLISARAQAWGPVIALAPASELVQSVLPGRTGRLDDVVADLGGLAVGAGLAAGARAGWKAWRAR